MKNSVLLYAAALLLTVSCEPKKAPEPAEPEVFDKQGMLANIADAVVMPAYNSFSSAVDSLIFSYQTFTISGSSADFIKVLHAFDKVYAGYQHISPHEFGPAEDVAVQTSFNIFPSDTVKINNHIASGSYNLDLASSLNAKGLPALEFLFYGWNATAESVAQRLVTHPARSRYAADLLLDMRKKISTVVSAWHSGYRSEFVSSLGNDVGSSIGFLVNRISFELDYLKNAKIGIPLGKKTLGQQMPGHCEALYSSRSVAYAMLTLDAIENLYRGRSTSGNDGIGFDDYLAHLGTRHVNGPLTMAIDNQFGLCRQKMLAITGKLNEEVITRPATVDAAYNELVRLLVLLKTDLSSALGVAITYQDGDGD
jgi:uncharacterized protein